MNSYKITYVIDEGETEQTFITERTETAARRVFKSMSGNREIVDVELYDTDVPATKQQEREALEKIKSMVAELGPNSYLKTAFEGVFEDAETNIENDFAFSMKARFENTEEKLKEMGSKYNALKTDASHMKERLEELGGLIDSLKDELRQKDGIIEQTRAAADSLNHFLAEQKEATVAESSRADTAEAEVIQLKAKLYDLLVK